jgi:hypothetical protein
LSAPAPATATLKCPKWSRLLPFGDEEDVAMKTVAAMLLHYQQQEWVVDGTMRAGRWSRRTQ